jgi:glucans biosynthesis protein C
MAGMSSTLLPLPTSRISAAAAAGGRERLHGLDALRAVAAVLVVLLHSGTPYIRSPMPGLVWPVRDVPSPLVDALFWAIEGCIMPLFFALAGFVAPALLRGMGPRAFVAHRARRLLLPMLFGCLIVLPCDLYVWLLGCVLDGRCTLRQMQTLKFEGDLRANLWGFSHLWFLQYLFLYCVGLAVAGTLRDRFRNRRHRRSLPFAEESRFDRLIRWWSKPLVIAAPAALVLWAAPEVVVGFQHSFLPVPAKFLHGAVFFAAGAWLQAARHNSEILTRHSGWYLLLAAGCFAAVLPLTHRYLTEGVTAAERPVFAAGMALFATLTVLGLSGRFLVWFPRPHTGFRYLAAASFWIYLVHHPIVGLAQIGLARAEIAPELKFATVAATALAFSLLTYESFVRRTWIGTMLNGSRRGGATDPAARPGSPKTFEKTKAA